MNIQVPSKRSAAINPLSIIDRVIEDLEITPKQHDEAIQCYQEVAKVLDKGIPGLNLAIHPQGSMRQGTTVRPINQEHFDLDVLCWMELDATKIEPNAVFDRVWEALGKNESYRGIRVKKARCVRLNCSPKNRFYLDVVPSVPDVSRERAMYVPDRELKIWCRSNPLVFCDEWFKKIGETLPTIRIMLTAKASRDESVTMSNAYVEPMPEYGAFEKTPLQRIVQLLKRDRDIHFQNDTDHRPASIILTTLTAHSYSSAVKDSYDDMLLFVMRVIEKLPDFIGSVGPLGKKKFSVMNPVNHPENFAERWTEEHYKRFSTWHARVLASLQHIAESKGRGADVMLERLSEKFGKEHVIKAANALGADTRSLHDEGKLRVKAGIVGAVGAVVPKTIYFGK